MSFYKIINILNSALLLISAFLFWSSAKTDFHLGIAIVLTSLFMLSLNLFKK